MYLEPSFEACLTGTDSASSRDVGSRDFSLASPTQLPLPSKRARAAPPGSDFRGDGPAHLRRLQQQQLRPRGRVQRDGLELRDVAGGALRKRFSLCDVAALAQHRYVVDLDGVGCGNSRFDVITVTLEQCRLNNNGEVDC